MLLYELQTTLSTSHVLSQQRAPYINGIFSRLQNPETKVSVLGACKIMTKTTVRMDSM